MRRSLKLLAALPAPLGRVWPVGRAQIRAFAAMAPIHDVAVVGGGVAGLACALELVRRGLDVQVLDMGARVSGGRCSAREMGELAFDHGCQLVLPQGRLFRQEVDTWVAAGAVQRWAGRFGHVDGGSGGFQPWPAADAHPAASGPTGPAAPESEAGFLAGLQPGPVFVGVPSMQSIPQLMVKQLEASGKGSVMISCKVESCEWDGQQGLWRLRGSPRGRAAAAAAAAAAAEGVRQQNSLELGPFRALVVADSLVALPDSAGYAKLCETGSAVASTAQQVGEAVQDPVFSLMVAFDPALEGIPFDAASVGSGSAWQWVACNSSKPGRPAGGPQCWVAVTTPAHARHLMQQFPLHIGGKYNPQSREYLEALAPVLYAEFQRLMAPFVAGKKGQLPQPAYCHAQRWGRAFISRPLGEPCVWAPEQRFAACGDFCLGPSLEDAWLSGRAAADAVATALQ